ALAHLRHDDTGCVCVFRCDGRLGVEEVVEQRRVAWGRLTALRLGGSEDTNAVNFHAEPEAVARESQPRIGLAVTVHHPPRVAGALDAHVHRRTGRRRQRFAEPVTTGAVIDRPGEEAYSISVMVEISSQERVFVRFDQHALGLIPLSYRGVDLDN